jgi:NADH-quinone oxidoreductase subunit H
MAFFAAAESLTFNDFSLLFTIILIVVVLAVIMGTCAYLILLERKIAAWAQDRIGPNRVGPLGLLQPIADGVKFLLKEDIIPSNVDKVFYLVAPAVAVGTALFAFVVVPFGRTDVGPTLIDHRNQVGAGHLVWPQTVKEEKELLAADKTWAAENEEPTYSERVEEYNSRWQLIIAPHVDIGIVFFLSIGSLAAYAIILGGWSSNSKYSLFGSLRSSAQLISYEIPMGLSILGVLLVTGSLNLERILDYQHDHGWNVLFQPLACLLFVIAIFAECNRLPFDLPEAEQELVGGYHTEYSSMKFALFFLGEYVHMITTSFLVVTLFFGGWLLPPGLTAPGTTSIVLPLIVFAAKMALFIIFFMVIRWTIPRFRFDQLMGLAWKVLLPLGLLNLVAVMFIKHFEPLGWNSPWLLLLLSLLFLVASGYITLQLPRTPTRARLTVHGHGTGQPVVTRYQPSNR